MVTTYLALVYSTLSPERGMHLDLSGMQAVYPHGIHATTHSTLLTLSGDTDSAPAVSATGANRHTSPAPVGCMCLCIVHVVCVCVLSSWPWPLCCLRTSLAATTIVHVCLHVRPCAVASVALEVVASPLAACRPG